MNIIKDGSRGSAACPRKGGRFVWRAPFRHARDGRRRAATWQTTVPGFPAGDRTKAVTGALVDAGATGHAFPWRGFPGRGRARGRGSGCRALFRRQGGGADGHGPRVFVIFYGFSHHIFVRICLCISLKKLIFYNMEKSVQHR